jgi:hypothetical protein
VKNLLKIGLVIAIIQFVVNSIPLIGDGHMDQQQYFYFVVGLTSFGAISLMVFSIYLSKKKIYISLVLYLIHGLFWILSWLYIYAILFGKLEIVILIDYLFWSKVYYFTGVVAGIGLVYNIRFTDKRLSFMGLMLIVYFSLMLLMSYRGLDLLGVFREIFHLLAIGTIGYVYYSDLRGKSDAEINPNEEEILDSHV